MDWLRSNHWSQGRNGDLDGQLRINSLASRSFLRGEDEDIYLCRGTELIDCFKCASTDVTVLLGKVCTKEVQVSKRLDISFFLSIDVYLLHLERDKIAGRV